MELEDALEVDYAKILLGFWLGFCEEYGFGTDFRGCRLCGKTTPRMFFHAKKGCVLCADCGLPLRGRLLPPAVFEMLHCAACSLPWRKADHASLLQALHLLADYLSYHSHKDLHLRSIRFFEALQAKSPSPMAHR
jgi:recombinational DNA repair protein (RecF pathway)